MMMLVTYYLKKPLMFGEYNRSFVNLSIRKKGDPDVRRDLNFRA